MLLPDFLATTPEHSQTTFCQLEDQLGPFGPASCASRFRIPESANRKSRLPAAHPGATLATLYDPDLMPANLRRAHTDLDRAVDRLYRPPVSLRTANGANIFSPCMRP